MAIKKGDRYVCYYCNRRYETNKEANKCTESHQLIYVGLTEADIRSIINFMHTKREEVLTEGAVKQFMKFNTLKQRLK